MASKKNLKARNKRLLRALATAQEQAALATERALEHREQARALLSERDDYRSRADELEAALAAVTESDECERLRAEVVRLVGRLAAAEMEANTRQDTGTALLREQSELEATLNRERSEWEDRRRAGEQQVARLVESNQQLRQDNAALRSQLDATHTTAGELRSTLASSRDERAQLQADLAGANAAADAAREELREEVAAHAIENGAVTTLQARIEELRTETATLTDQLAMKHRDIETLLAQRDEARETTRKQLEQIAALNTSYAEMRESRDYFMAKYDALAGTDPVDPEVQRLIDLATHMGEERQPNFGGILPALDVQPHFPREMVAPPKPADLDDVTEALAAAAADDPERIVELIAEVDRELDTQPQLLAEPSGTLETETDEEGTTVKVTAPATEATIAPAARWGTPGWLTTKTDTPATDAFVARTDLPTDDEVIDPEEEAIVDAYADTSSPGPLGWDGPTDDVPTLAESVRRDMIEGAGEIIAARQAVTGRPLLWTERETDTVRVAPYAADPISALLAAQQDEVGAGTVFGRFSQRGPGWSDTEAERSLERAAPVYDAEAGEWTQPPYFVARAQAPEAVPAYTIGYNRAALVRLLDEGWAHTLPEADANEILEALDIQLLPIETPATDET